MDETEHTDTVVVRDNTKVMLLLVITVFISMVLLTIILVRFGEMSRKLDRIVPPRFMGGNDVQFFYVN